MRCCRYYPRKRRLDAVDAKNILLAVGPASVRPGAGARSMQSHRPRRGLDPHHRRPVFVGRHRLAQDGSRQGARLAGNRLDIAAALPVYADAVAQCMDAGYAGLQCGAVHRNAVGPGQTSALRQPVGGAAGPRPPPLRQPQNAARWWWRRGSASPCVPPSPPADRRQSVWISPSRRQATAGLPAGRASAPAARLPCPAA